MQPMYFCPVERDSGVGRKKNGKNNKKNGYIGSAFPIIIATRSFYFRSI